LKIAGARFFFTDCTHALRASRYPTEETILTAIERDKNVFCCV